ncbi:6-phosphogluconolactonase [Zhongshania aliphaticivorans]|uniref:6-phosphogluconolactonase n=1 Tax=Zhongshania aliphaticivorans TaxID=1470434 RepID=A0A5S9NJZ6_9GAMM|nr:6-phosphogluconolactonase [Zhongshania aliphaticivorans]CAA0090957.1 6-phosphogluconolactonase [Zhongshania aliphaticivorans]CAA0098456.1 6-phosphogluconolactonase [Zhongshania aliphaticivorans]
MAATEFFYTNRPEMVAALVEEIAGLLNEAIAARGQASFLVSGGSSPQAVYDALAERQLDWSKVIVALVDERWVPSDHSASNEDFISRHLLRGPAADATFLTMKTDALNAAEGLTECEARYAALPSHADVCLLGMGGDGHTASLFPHAEGLAAAMAQDSEMRCAVIEAKPSEVTGSHTERMTLTRRYIAAARKRLLLIAGTEKQEVYHLAKACEDSNAMPVSAVLATEIDVYWAP